MEKLRLKPHGKLAREKLLRNRREAHLCTRNQALRMAIIMCKRAA